MKPSEKTFQLQNQLRVIIVIFLIPLKKLYYMKNVLLLLSTVLIFIGCSTNNNGTVTVVPIAPTNLTGSVISTSQVNLSWTDNATNEDGYKIERKSGSGTYAVVGSMGVNLTTFSDLGLTPNTTYTYRVYANNSAGNSLQYSNEVTVTTQDNIPSWLTNGLVAFYPFSGNAGDSSGNGNHGMVNGATLTTDRFGNNDKAYNFTGSTTIPSYIQGDCSSFPTGNRTVSLWFYANDIGVGTVGGRGLFGYGGGTCGQSWIEHVNVTQNPNSFEVQGHCNVQNVSYNYGATHPNGSWYNWIITTDNNGTKFYLDGVLKQTSPTFINQTVISGKKFIIGGVVSENGLGLFTGNSDASPFNGKLDDIRIYNRALSQSEVTYLATH